MAIHDLTFHNSSLPARTVVWGERTRSPMPLGFPDEAGSAQPTTAARHSGVARRLAL